MSAFIRRQPVRAVDLGTRPGLHGQVLISFGLSGVDKLLGGGLPLGSILLIIEDSNSQQHLNLLKCFMAEGVCCKHTVAWISANALTADSTAAFLPCVAKSQSSNSQQQVRRCCSTHKAVFAHPRLLATQRRPHSTTSSCLRRLQLDKATAAIVGVRLQAQHQAAKTPQTTA
eukprot:GHUV01041197.1.p1 GENE.GHUV01041197.1~~GHUV01041197.1.p1  ORF type:complete len:192 (+),score=42.43 GHUV01041197.1:63-578(+)